MRHAGSPGSIEPARLTLDGTGVLMPGELYRKFLPKRASASSKRMMTEECYVQI
jgi:hypothetical protein